MKRKLIEPANADLPIGKAIRPVALVNGDARGTTQLVDRFEKTSRITTGDVARWMLDAVERPAAFEQRTEMIGASNVP